MTATHMTGPEHFRQAERILADASDSYVRVERADLFAQAQVHATLALAAATALGAVSVGTGLAHRDQWDGIATTPPSSNGRRTR